MKINEKTPLWLRLFIKQIIGPSFTLGALVAFVLFFGTRLLFSSMIACYVSLTYSFFYVGIKFLKEKKLDFYGTISIIFLLVTAATLYISDNEKLFLYKNVIDELIYSGVFVVSLVMKKPVMQIIVEKANPVPPEISQHALYKKIWRDETVMWSVYYILWFCAQIFCIQTLSTAEVYFLQKVLGKILFYGLLAFSFYYPTRTLNKMQVELASVAANQVEMTLDKSSEAAEDGA